MMYSSPCLEREESNIKKSLRKTRRLMTCTFLSILVPGPDGPSDRYEPARRASAELADGIWLWPRRASLKRPGPVASGRE
jgi:hypothetical protein